MVMSGLVDRTDVSHFRLSAHLLLALFIMAALIWTALDLRRLARTGVEIHARLRPASLAAAAILFVQLLLGVWVAGLNAGYVSSTWPLMNGQLVPDGIDWSNGVGFALTHDPFLIHFLHRWWAWVVVAALVIFARTVETGMNIIMAALHQAIGASLVAAFTWGAHAYGRKGI